MPREQTQSLNTCATHSLLLNPGLSYMRQLERERKELRGDENDQIKLTHLLSTARQSWVLEKGH